MRAFLNNIISSVRKRTRVQPQLNKLKSFKKTISKALRKTRNLMAELFYEGRGYVQDLEFKVYLIFPANLTCFGLAFK